MLCLIKYTNISEPQNVVNDCSLVPPGTAAAREGRNSLAETVLRYGMKSIIQTVEYRRTSDKCDIQKYVA